MKNVETIYPYIDPAFQVIDDNQTINFFHHADAIHLVISGKIAKSKGQEDAVLAGIDLIKHHKIELLLVGSGDPVYINRLTKIIGCGC